MAHLISNTFSSFSLLPEEEESGQLLSDLQKMVIQNKLAMIAADKLKIEFNPLLPLEFAQQEAYLRGQLDALQWQLDVSQEVETLVKSRTNSN